MEQLKRWFVVLAVLFSAFVGRCTDVSFPTLPSDTWTSSLSGVFVAAAAVGLGILGLRLVISMIKAGLAMRRAR